MWSTSLLECLVASSKTMSSKPRHNISAQNPLKTADFDYNLPPSLIAQEPAKQRDSAKMLTLDRGTGETTHRRFHDLPARLRPGDVLVMNDSRVVPARLHGQKIGGGANVQMLLLEETNEGHWWAMLRPGKRLPIGTQILLHNKHGQATEITATVLEKNDEGHACLKFEGTKDFLSTLDQFGEAPLPPYIRRPTGNHSTDTPRYQTIFANSPGSVAAPTAGLHFTPTLLNTLRQRGIITCTLTLHVGFGTFAPIKAERITDHHMHSERYTLPAATAAIINQARRDHRRIITVGTTTLRVLESIAQENTTLNPGSGRTDIFIHPPYEFQIVDALITNFHLPQSTLLMLVSAFGSPGETSGREMMLAVYAKAIRKKYRFFSYGDAMFIQ
jgi:S-adenosylmethionine:tRNA ribosyltransferase-isomerase